MRPAAYYNEFDPKAAAWLRELIAGGHIAPGYVDERSIADVRPADLVGYRQCHFFAGIGGWSLALRLAGWPDDRPVWTGSCPCQPFSAAGKGGGAQDARHLWPEFGRLIAECRPPVVFGEQVASAAGRDWLTAVRLDLETLGYGVGAADLCAAGSGAPHIRQRLYWVADAERGTAERWGHDMAGAPGHAQGEAREREWVRDDGGTGGPTGGLADRDPARCHAGRPGEAGNGGGSPRLESSGLRTAGGLADRQGDGRGQGPADDAGRGTGTGTQGVGLGPADHRGGGGVAHAERERGCGGATRQQDASDVGLPGEAGGPVRGGFWGDLEWLPCRDGKWRPTQPGLHPLVAGVSKGLVRSSDPGAPIDADHSAEGRVMRLRGYGNAINIEVARTFVEAYRGIKSL